MSKTYKDKIRDIYEKKYKILLIIPSAIFILAILLLFTNYLMTGDFVEKGISLKGGTSITILSEDITPENLQSSLQYEGQTNIRVMSSAASRTGLILEVESTDEQVIDTIVNDIQQQFNLNEEEITEETIGSALGQSFFRETFIAMIVAFIFMAIVVFLYFRTFIPGIAVILAAVSDIVVTLAISNLIGIKLSTAGIAAFLMLIGYSVDTDILLTTKVIKKKTGTVDERIYSAMKTGLMMSVTTIVAISVALIFSQSNIISQIMTIVLIGLIVDLIYTWIQNAGILRWYMEKKHESS